MIKYAIAFPVAWIFYGIGHIASLVFERTESSAAWKIYTFMMRISCAVSDWGGKVIWD